MGGPGADEVVGRYLQAQVEALVRLGPGVRVDAPDAVHQMRVAARRLRSVIGTFQPLLERRRTETVRVGLRVLGEALAPVRDSEVMAAWFAGVDPEPAVLLVQQSLQESHALGRARLLATFDDGRHEALVRSLTSMLDPSPFRPRAAAPAGPTLLPLLQEADARVELAATLALAADAASRDEHLHEVRKLSKRARYAAEAAAPALGEPARALAAAMASIAGRARPPPGQRPGDPAAPVGAGRPAGRARRRRPDGVRPAHRGAARPRRGRPRRLRPPARPHQSRNRLNRGSLSHHGRSRPGSPSAAGADRISGRRRHARAGPLGIQLDVDQPGLHRVGPHPRHHHGGEQRQPHHLGDRQHHRTAEPLVPHRRRAPQPGASGPRRRPRR